MIDQCARLAEEAEEVSSVQYKIFLRTRREVGININNEIYAAQIRAVYQQTPMVLIVNVVNSALVALILGSYAEHTGWWIFFGWSSR